MNEAGCFEAGVAGATAGEAQFAQGNALMYAGLSSFKSTLNLANPQFHYAFHAFPGGTRPAQTTTFLNLNYSLSVNARSSTRNQAAAQTFVDFIARPEQNALYTKIQGGVTQYEFMKGQLPAFMSPLIPVLRDREYVVNPQQTWWNANVLLALAQNGIGLITGQRSIDDVLNAMDAAWQQGPS
jgi:raffinose/stachyose/melibiose transport system substrate-binding protein